MAINVSKFGELQNKKTATLYKLQNSDISICITDFGASIQSILIKDKNDNLKDIVLGYDSIEKYENDKNNYFGSTIGPNSNRIQNAKFELNGKTYNLEKNDNNHNLHSGEKGFSRKLWMLDENESSFKKNILCLKLYSKHLENDFPSNLKCEVVFTLTENNELIIKYKATSDNDTIFNPTNHTYFNLNGHSCGFVLNTHNLKLNANYYTKTDKELIPTGEIVKVHNEYDYTTSKTINSNLDTNFIINNDSIFSDIKEYIKSKPAAILKGINTNISIELYTSSLGLQVYTGEFIKNKILGKDETTYEKNSGICLETQFFPNSINQENFTKPILKKNEEKVFYTIFKFN